MIAQKLTLKTRIGYGIGDISICLYWSGVGLYLLYFYTDVVGISPALAGAIYQATGTRIRELPISKYDFEYKQTETEEII